jgi:hypothetical protein
MSRRELSSEPSRRFVQGLGGVVLNFAGLEESLRNAILLMARSECDSEGRATSILTARMPFPTLVDSFGALCKDLGTARTDAGDPTEFCSYLLRLNEERNTVIHSTWWSLPTPAGGLQRSKRSAKPKTGFRLKVSETDVDDIGALADRLGDASQKVWEFVPLRGQG